VSLCESIRVLLSSPLKAGVDDSTGDQERPKRKKPGDITPPADWRRETPSRRERPLAQREDKLFVLFFRNPEFFELRTQVLLTMPRIGSSAQQVLGGPVMLDVLSLPSKASITHQERSVTG
jgi:hypothetical protein